MTTGSRAEMVDRDRILRLLSKDEIGRVSTAETALNLPKGDEYLDLSHLDQGIQKANGGAVVMGHILSRKSVTKDTWARILADVGAQESPKTNA